MTRELLSTRTGKSVGSITETDGTVTYQGAAQSVLRYPVKTRGIREIMAEGWSNGNLYLGPEKPDRN